MKADLFSLDGKKLKTLELPEQFNEPIRKDLIWRAVLALKSKKRTSYGTKKEAGKRHSVTLSKRRRKYKGVYGHGWSRTPRKVLTKRGSQFYYVGAFVPFAVGGRRAHPPKPEKIWELKINKKERRKAIRSALAATQNLELVKQRGHKVEKLIPAIDSKIEEISKTKEAQKILLALGLEKELERVSVKKIRSGRGKSRGRKYKTKRGPLIVVSKFCPLIKSTSSIQGVETCEINKLNVEALAPGTIPGRLTIFTEDSLRILGEKKLFTNEKIIHETKKIQKITQEIEKPKATLKKEKITAKKQIKKEAKK